LWTAATILERDRVAARMQFRCVAGPFKHSQSDRRFTRIGDCGCRVAFGVSHEIADGLLDRLVWPAVDLVAHSIMDAFVRPADATLAMAGAPAAAPVTSSTDDHEPRPSHPPLPRTP
jgi:ribosome-associated toxin RatA of RatAB toxin-antitoxin module